MLSGLWKRPTFDGYTIESSTAINMTDADRKRMYEDMKMAISTARLPGASSGGPFFDPNTMQSNPGDIRTDAQRMAQLEMRLRITSHELRQKLLGLGTTYEEGVVYVHFVRAGQLQVFTDEPGLFPSDALVNNLRLCL